MSDKPDKPSTINMILTAVGRHSTIEVEGVPVTTARDVTIHASVHDLTTAVIKYACVDGVKATGEAYVYHLCPLGGSVDGHENKWDETLESLFPGCHIEMMDSGEMVVWTGHRFDEDDEAGVLVPMTEDS